MNNKRSWGHSPVHLRQTGMCETLMEEDIIRHHLSFDPFFAPSAMYTAFFSLFECFFFNCHIFISISMVLFHLCLLSLYPLLNAFFFFYLFEHVGYIILIWLGCYHKIPQTRRLLNHRNVLSHSSRGPKSDPQPAYQHG